MASQFQKKISIPNEKLLHKEKYKKRKSKLVWKNIEEEDDETDENTNEMNLINKNNLKQLKEIQERFGEVIKSNLFKDNISSQKSYNNDNDVLRLENPNDVKIETNNDCQANCLLKEIFDDNINESQKYKPQSVSLLTSLHQKGCKISYNQRFGNETDPSYGLPGFFSKRDYKH